MNALRADARKKAPAQGGRVGVIALTALAAGVTLAVLGGCGDVSLLTVFDEEANAQPIDVEPDGKYLPLAWPITLTVSGGVEPYTYAFDPPIGTWDPDDGSVTYTAPGSINEEIEEVTLVVTDFLGKQKSAKVKVHSPLEVDPPVFTLAVGETQDITLSGGVRDYVVEYAGAGTVERTANPHMFRYTAPKSAGTDGVVFKDATNTALNTLKVSITVTNEGALAVNPASAVVRPGGSVSFVATGGVGSPIRYIIGQTPGDVGYGATAPSSASEGDTRRRGRRSGCHDLGYGRFGHRLFPCEGAGSSGLSTLRSVQPRSVGKEDQDRAERHHRGDGLRGEASVHLRRPGARGGDCSTGRRARQGALHGLLGEHQEGQRDDRRERQRDPLVGRLGDGGDPEALKAT
jgi:hypothetical protein